MEGRRRTNTMRTQTHEQRGMIRTLKFARIRVETCANPQTVTHDRGRACRAAMSRCPAVHVSSPRAGQWDGASVARQTGCRAARWTREAQVWRDDNTAVRARGSDTHVMVSGWGWSHHPTTIASRLQFDAWIFVRRKCMLSLCVWQSSTVRRATLGGCINRDTALVHSVSRVRRGNGWGRVGG